MVVVISGFKLTWFSVVIVNKTNLAYIFVWERQVSHRQLYNTAVTFCSDWVQVFYLLYDVFFMNIVVLESFLLSFCPALLPLKVDALFM